MAESNHTGEENFDDFDIEEFLRQVDFNDEPAPSPSVSAKPHNTSSGARADFSVSSHPQRKHHRKKRLPLGVRILRRIIFILIWLIIIVIVGYFLANYGWNWANDLLALNKPEVSTTVTLEESWFSEEEITDKETGEVSTVTVADMDEVAEVLNENGLIEYNWLFKLYTSFTNKESSLVPGTYELNSDMDYSALLRSMGPTSVARTTVTVTVPEGYTLEQIITLLAEQEVAEEADLRETASDYDFDYEFLDRSTLGEENRLEGYLFPDTYEFYQDGDAVTALSRMLDNFNTRFYTEIDESVREDALDRGYSVQELIVIASMIEKETDGRDQSEIASVIYNRLNNESGGTNGFLQIDSTIQYILDERKEVLTYEDLLTDSPYNTYLYQGLPPGPICCPGLDAIEAALSPDTTDYYYYVLGDDNVHHFFSDYEEFLAFRDTQTGQPEEEEYDVPEG